MQKLTQIFEERTNENSHPGMYKGSTLYKLIIRSSFTQCLKI